MAVRKISLRLPLHGFCLLLARSASSSSDNTTSSLVPETLCSPFGSYPNPLGVTEQDRASFHPVVKLPYIWSEETKECTPDQENPKSTKKGVRVPHVTVGDYTKPSTDRSALCTEEEIANEKIYFELLPWWRRQLRLLVPSFRLFLSKLQKDKGPRYFSIGRYDEDRVIYVSKMFENTEHSIDGYAGARTVHVGIDLGGPVGAKVHAFTDGVIHSAGYNSEHGDYGNVVVIEHTVPSNGRKFWALYGHLDHNSIQGKSPGQKVSKGQVIGRLGDIFENGGWLHPHVHFQLSTEPPETHDMPGAVATQDRPQALHDYPDPRWVLGTLY